MTEDQEFKVHDRRAGQEAANESANKPQSGCGCAADSSPHEHMFPSVTFSTFVLSLSSSALVHLGEVPDPDSGQFMKNLPVAKHTIDILEMLQDKTSRCLDPDEARLLGGILYELRMKYVMLDK